MSEPVWAPAIECCSGSAQPTSANCSRLSSSTSPATSPGRRSPVSITAGRWRLREAPGGRTRVEFRLAYVIAGAGLSGWLAERIAAPTVTRHVNQTLRQLDRLVEQKQPRERAAARRRAAPRQ
jgi:hypothetical protein